MSEKTGILRSRYIGVAFVGLLLLIAGITAASVFIADRNLKSPEKIEKAVSTLLCLNTCSYSRNFYRSYFWSYKADTKNI